MRHGGTHETCFSPAGPDGKPVGDIELRITYEVTSFGRPARVHYDEHDYPAESAEVDLIHVEMLNAPKSGRKAEYIDAWDWLFDWVTDWCGEHAAELAAAVSLDIASRHEDRQEG